MTQCHKNLSIIRLRQQLVIMSIIAPILNVNVQLVQIFMVVYGTLYGVSYLNNYFFLNMTLYPTL